jgi:CRP/FNR family transcriptional regulator, cyclic AMP receptor protein
MPMGPARAERLLSLLDERERAALDRRARRTRFDAGSRLLQQGEPGDKVVVLLEGRAKISYVTREGRELVLRFCGPGELVGELAVIDGSPRLSSVVALEPVEALLLAAVDFRALLDAEPSISWKLLGMLSRRFRDADLKRVEFGASDTVGRVAARLVELADRYGEPAEGGIRITLPLSQDELGAWTGASRAGVAAALRTLRDLDWIETRRRRITVRDRDALAARASVQN